MVGVGVVVVQVVVQVVVAVRKGENMGLTRLIICLFYIFYI